MGILTYSEITLEVDYVDNHTDGVIGMHWIRDNKLCLRTERKEIVIELEHAPTIEKIL